MNERVSFFHCRQRRSFCSLDPTAQITEIESPVQKIAAELFYFFLFILSIVIITSRTGYEKRRRPKHLINVGPQKSSLTFNA